MMSEFWDEMTFCALVFYVVYLSLSSLFHPGPRLDMDPDIVAALDEDFDFEDPSNVLDDDFVLKANEVTDGDMG